MTSQEVAWTLVRTLIRRHGIPQTMVSDRGSQFDKLIPIAELAINTRTSSATGVSPFYLTHGYDLSLFGLTEDLPEQSADQSPIQIRENIACMIKEAMDWAKASLAYSQQEAEHQANKK
ncbi:hypothetical protein AN0537.2 [Aspergillus nidulans FGSC A4]|uniref:Integrase catalytic domain-containing protein n=1 Tax=Emericella nidulans (strain FGSC A4 / ATCC 38163 / CBS 112.46 / NRRL 194 / M139) TaxID=227321 RepID=Q5BFZ3_EMENI|nr:hypothetical protein [Aspergillus nidulans FGSC A4]EAA66636.1 hypothetical protein AN0537.2 [Aspergillus nidulans FGSC A4]CBF89285.1 TPA: conserved hypothetical protein [Aspergillus nidulans FGSC A4]|eukprot:XP_658141.1 hypothetical protein AN0537.2 [Aspergillus nidulans FGSC A4]